MANKKLQFIVPEFWRLRNIWSFVLKTYQTNNELFIENREINTIYGCFPNMCWNGGRVCVSKYTPTKQDIINMFELYHNYGISLTLSMTNLLLNESHLSDEYCNMVLDIANQEKYQTKVLTSLEFLEQYIRSKYKNIKHCKSIQVTSTDKPYYENDYYLTVLSIDKNKDFDFLKTIKNPENIEILVTQDCIPNCPLRIKHLEYTSMMQLKMDNKETPMCPFEHDPLFWSTSIKSEELHKYEELGFRYFKLTDRDVDNNEMLKQTLWNICNYLIKQKYREEFYQILANISLFGEGYVD